MGSLQILPISSLFIAVLIWSNCTNAPDGHNQNESVPPNAVESPVVQGKELAQATGRVLVQNLIKAIGESGPERALEFCNIQAYPLTDSMSTVLNANIKRVSDQARNPNNRANEQELAYILQAKQELAQGKSLNPQMHQANGKNVGYYPIVTNQLCLQCHGKPNEDIQEGTLKKLATLYPEDQAKEYGPNELRGIWVVEMDIKQQ